MYNTNAGEDRCQHHNLLDDDDLDRRLLLLLLLFDCSAELPLPLNLLDAAGQGIVGNGQDWNASVELSAITSSAPLTIFRDTRLLHLALFRRPSPLRPLPGSTVHLTSLHMTSPPVPPLPAAPFRSSSFIGGLLCSFCRLLNSLGFGRAFCYTHIHR